MSINPTVTSNYTHVATEQKIPAQLRKFERRAKQNHTTMLVEASQAGDLEVVKYGIAHTPEDLNTFHPHNLTPLCGAIIAGHIDIAEVLINCERVDVNQAAVEGFTPLFIACQEGYIDLARLLAKKGADVNSAIDTGGTALIIAVQEERFDMVEFLIENGADVNHKMSNAEATPLILASRTGSVALASVLIKAGSEVNFAPENGPSALYTACVFKHIDLVNYLLAAGADVNLAASPLGTPLSGASKIGMEEITRVLLDAGAKNNDGQTALQVACEENDHSECKRLLEKYNDPKLTLMTFKACIEKSFKQKVQTAIIKELIAAQLLEINNLEKDTLSFIETFNEWDENEKDGALETVKENLTYQSICKFKYNIEKIDEESTLVLQGILEIKNGTINDSNKTNWIQYQTNSFEKKVKLISPKYSLYLDKEELESIRNKLPAALEQIWQTHTIFLSDLIEQTESFNSLREILSPANIRLSTSKTRKKLIAKLGKKLAKIKEALRNISEDSTETLLFEQMLAPCIENANSRKTHFDKLDAMEDTTQSKMDDFYRTGKEQLKEIFRTARLAPPASYDYESISDQATLLTPMGDQSERVRFLEGECKKLQSEIENSKDALRKVTKENKATELAYNKMRAKSEDEHSSKSDDSSAVARPLKDKMSCTRATKENALDEWSKAEMVVPWFSQNDGVMLERGLETVGILIKNVESAKTKDDFTKILKCFGFEQTRPDPHFLLQQTSYHEIIVGYSGHNKEELKSVIDKVRKDIYGALASLALALRASV